MLAGRQLGQALASKGGWGSALMYNGRNYLTSPLLLLPWWMPGFLCFPGVYCFTPALTTSRSALLVYRQQVVDEHPKPEQVCLTSQQRAPWWQPDHPVPSWSFKLALPPLSGNPPVSASRQTEHKPRNTPRVQDRTEGQLLFSVPRRHPYFPRFLSFSKATRELNCKFQPGEEGEGDKRQDK